MKILALDTSGHSAGVALLCGGDIVYETSRHLHRSHSTEILGMVDETLQSQGIGCQDIDVFACVTGPGSFTGVRIGVSTIKGFAQATGKPCIGIHALQALAAGAGEAEGTCCPMLDARSRQVYAAAFSPGPLPARVLPDMADSLDAFLAKVQTLPGRLCFVGDGAAAHATEIRETIGDRAFFAEGREDISAGVVARMARALYPAHAQTYLQLMPYYLRAPQAERERLAKEGKEIHEAR